MHNEENSQNKKLLILKLVFIIIGFLIILVLFYLLSEYGANPLIIILILTFTFFTFIGPLYKRKRKSLYSRMLPKKGDKRSRLDEIRERKGFKKKREIIPNKSKNLKPISLDFEYRKPLVRKCENCGMILASFVKKCPLCGKLIISS